MADWLVTDRTTGKKLASLLFPLTDKGATSSEFLLNLQNTSGGDFTVVRLFAKPITGLLSGQEDVEGQEASDERWLEVRVPPSAYQGIGGAYGDSDPAANYVDIGPILDGADKDLDVRVVIPLGASTGERSYVRLGISYE